MEAPASAGVHDNASQTREVYLDPLELAAVALHAAQRDAAHLGPVQGLEHVVGLLGPHNAHHEFHDSFLPIPSMTYKVRTNRAGPSRVAAYTKQMPSESQSDSTFTLYRRGIELLEEEDFEEAAAPLEEAARRAPEKTSVREALGRAYFRAGRFAAAAEEFAAVVERHQVDDYAHFCLGRALSKTGETERARHHLALASNLRPDRSDYSFYRAMLGA